MVVQRRFNDVFSWGVLTCAVVMWVVVCSSIAYGQGVPSIGNPLRYHWQPGSGVGYEVDITVDLPNAVETYKGAISYTLDGTAEDLLKITFSGGLTKTETVKQRPSGPGGHLPFSSEPAAAPGPGYRNPFTGLEKTSNTILMTPLGEVRGLDGTSQLPFLLGNLSLLPLETLPEANQSSWKVDSGGTVAEGEDRLGEPGFGPSGPRSFTEGKAGTQKSASLTTSYRVEQSQGDLVTIAKAFQMKSPGTSESAEINGTGKWTFNHTLGVPEELDFQQKLAVNIQNVTITIPMTVKYRRFADAEWKALQEEARLANEKSAQKAAEAKAAAMAKAAADAVVPLTAEERTQILADIATDNFFKCKPAMEKLAAKTPQASDPEIVQAIQSKLNDPTSLQQSALRALKNWAPELAHKHELNKSYAQRQAVESTGRSVDATTPLAVGQIVQARDYSGWHPAEIRELPADGKVRLRYRGGGWPPDQIFSLSDVQLAPDEVDQPNLDPQALARLRALSEPQTSSAGSEPAWRTWTDNTGTFSVEAQFLGVSDGKVRLRRKGGPEIAVPLERLSENDRQEVQKLQQTPAPAANPFGS